MYLQRRKIAAQNNIDFCERKIPPQGCVLTLSPPPLVLKTFLCLKNPQISKPISLITEPILGILVLM